MNQQDEHQQNEDLYETLNLPRSATQSQIKTAYRKLALKFHPDRQSTPEEKHRCNDIFTNIGNAYEVLSDKKRRDVYDRYGTTDTGNAANTTSNEHEHPSTRQQQHSSDQPSFGRFFRGRDPFQDQFFTRSGNGQQGHAGFMDPFDLFQQFFGEDFSHRFHNEDYLPRGRSDQHGFGNMNMNMGMNMGMDMGRHFGGGFGNFMGMNNFGGLEPHMNAMNSMMNMQQGNQPQQQQQQQQQRQGFTSNSYCSSSSYGGGNGGVQESVSTSTQIINGRRQTVTERVRVTSDGTVERHTETSGDDDFPVAGLPVAGYLGYNNGTNLRQNELVPSISSSNDGEIRSSGHSDEHKHDATLPPEEDTKKMKKKRKFLSRKTSSDKANNTAY